MAGQIRRLIDEIIERKSHGNIAIMGAIKTKLILKGIKPDIYTATSPDDPLVMGKIRDLAREMGI
jgi:hypothetical protein